MGAGGEWEGGEEVKGGRKAGKPSCFSKSKLITSWGGSIRAEVNSHANHG